MSSGWWNWALGALLRRPGLASVDDRRELGARGERIAAALLRRRGYRVLARNLRGRHGEIDILAMAPRPNDRTLVVVEVKAARREPGPDAPAPEVHVNAAKMRRLVRLAHTLARRYAGRENHGPIRFDVIGIDFPARGRPVIRHHVGAFASTI